MGGIYQREALHYPQAALRAETVTLSPLLQDGTQQRTQYWGMHRNDTASKEIKFPARVGLNEFQ